MNGLDKLDDKILRELDFNSRIPASKIGRLLRVSKETVNYRINRMVEGGFIQFFYTVFNMNKVGYQYYKVLIKLHHTNPGLKDELMEFVRGKSCCANFRILEGSYDLDFLAIVDGPGELECMLNELKSKFGEHILDKEIHNVMETYIFYLGKKHSKLSKKSIGEDGRVDRVDKKIMNVLSRNGRMRFTELGERVGVHPKVASYRVRKMQENGIIVGYTSKINFDKLGLDSFQVNISMKKNEELPEVVSFFDSSGKCTFAHQLLGKYDLSAELHVENNRELSRIMDDFRNNFSNRYTSADVSNVISEHVLGWSPFKQEEGL